MGRAPIRQLASKAARESAPSASDFPPRYQYQSDETSDGEFGGDGELCDLSRKRRRDLDDEESGGPPMKRVASVDVDPHETIQELRQQVKELHQFIADSGLLLSKSFLPLRCHRQT